MGKAIYAIDAFPDDNQLWRIEWIGGIRYNTSVPSDPLVEICLAQLPRGRDESARSRSSQTKTTVSIGVGLLPYISIASVWRKRRPVMTDCAAYRHRLQLDAKACRTIALGELTASHNGLPRRYYRFGPSWPDVRGTLLVAVEQDVTERLQAERALVLLRTIHPLGSSAFLGGVPSNVQRRAKRDLRRRRRSGPSTTLAGRSGRLDLGPLHMLASDAARSA